MSTRFYQSLLLGFSIIASSWATAAVKEYHLNIAEGAVNITGKSVKRITVNGQFPAPLLEFEEGDDAVIHVHNDLKKQDSSIHWHGILLPGIMDGVPGFNGFNAIKPNANFVYKFKVRQSGTYWYHAHSKGQEQDGLYGALVIYPKGKKPIADHEKAERDYVVMLSDFHPSTSAQIQNNLKKDAEYYQNQRQTIFDVMKQAKQTGVKATWQDRSMWNEMRMSKTDLSDVTGYTFLVNGQTAKQNWTGAFKPNEKVRLRFINAAAMSFFDVRIPDLKMTVVSADGQPVKPVVVDEFRIGAAETYDVIVEPKAEHYQIQAESIDRSGFALASLHNENHQMHQQVNIPQSRPRALLTMQDMGHGSSSTHHASTDHSTMNHSNMAHDVDHSKHQKAQVEDSQNHDRQNQSSQNQSTQNQHSQAQDSMRNMNYAEMDQSSTNPQNMKQMDHSEHQNMNATFTSSDSKESATNSNKSHAIAEGWANASTPIGMKALQYSDLKSLTPQPDVREPETELVIHLGGSMQRYIWTINGKKFSEAEPLKVKFGQRIRLKFLNDSMMAHPMHLHGMFMQLENGQASVDMPNKHTIIVPPNKTVTALLTADELGEWAIHCHLLYHMTSGMMSKLIVAHVDDSAKSSISKQSTIGTESKKGETHEHH